MIALLFPTQFEADTCQELNKKKYQTFTIGVGKTESLVNTIKLLSGHTQNYEAFYLMGIAGAYKSQPNSQEKFNLNLGDIVCVKNSILTDEGEFVRDSNDKNKYSFKTILTEPYAKHQTRSYSLAPVKDLPQVDCNTVSIISSIDWIASEFQLLTNAHIEDMEGFAVATAFKHLNNQQDNHIKNLHHIRAISNYCGDAGLSWNFKIALDAMKEFAHSYFK